jgi:uncharacterized protein YaiI (UPF0178 family)
MNIWVDADACPRVVKEILYRAADRTAIALTLVANSMLATPPSRWIRAVQVPGGFDVADAWIVEHLAAGDLVITADIPLAAEVLGKGAHALSPRGERFTHDTIAERLSVRDFLDTMRASGVMSGGPPPLSQADRAAFANALDRLLVVLQRQG